MFTAIAEHGNHGSWNGTSATTAPVTVVVCSNDADVLDGQLKALDAHEIVFGRPTGDHAGETKTEDTQASLSFLLPPPDGNENRVFATVTNLNAHPTTLHTAPPLTTALLLGVHRPALGSAPGGVPS
ncbi:hypothetical protein EDB85DRAFT_2298654 [Lactarius pseudohatsudake]|nr:hypothetical protein EDB85DRAFT_2298654 [Lactarius pseudohatsudake]